MSRTSLSEMSLRDRRLRTLQRTGVTTKRTEILRAPSVEFYGVVLVTMGLTMLGLVMVMSSSSIAMFHDGESPWGLVRKQILWAVLGIIGAWSAYRLDYRALRRIVKPILIGAVALTLTPFVPGLGAEVNGARAWAGWGFLRIQPSEALKLAVVIFCADLLAKRHRYIEDERMTLYPVGAVMGLAAAICAAQRDFGSALIFCSIGLALCFLAGMPGRSVGLAGLIVVATGMTVMYSSANARSRLTVFLDLEGTRAYEGYQVWQSLLSVANGGLTGVGVGQGSGKWGYVPLAYSDFIFSTVAEELGMVGSGAVIGGFAALVYFGVRISLGAKDMFGALLAGGIATWFGVQSLVNIGGVTGALPMTGLTLPFISYGGSSLCVSLVATGLLLNVARRTK